MLLFLGDYLHAPNKMYRCFPPRDIDDQRILRSDWMRAFWPVTCQTNFSQLQILYRKTKNFKVFQFRLLPAKSNEKKYENLRKLYFEPFLSILAQTTICLGNPSVTFFSFQISIAAQQFRKTESKNELVTDVQTDKHELIRLPFMEVQKYGRLWRGNFRNKTI